MSELTITLTNSLDCSDCSDVLLRLHNPYLLAVNDGVVDLNLVDHFLLGKILSHTKLSSTSHVYVVYYDEDLLQTPEAPLTQCDVREVCCAGCIIDYIDELLRTAPAGGGVTAVVGGSACNSIGAGTSIRDASIAGSTLTLEGAPEHNIVTATNAYVTSAVPHVMSAGQFLSEVANVQVTAPPCRDLHIIAEATHILTMNYIVGLSDIRLVTEYSLTSSAGPWTEISSNPEGILLPAGTSLSFNRVLHSHINLDVSAGNTIDIWTRARVDLVSGSGSPATILTSNGKLTTDSITKQ